MKNGVKKIETKNEYMTVDDLRSALSLLSGERHVIIQVGKYGYAPVRFVETGYYDDQTGEFNHDEECGEPAILIKS